MIKIKPFAEQIKLGKQGENLARVVFFDEPELWKAALGEGKCELIHQRKGDSAPYPVKLNVVDGKVCWIISNADTANTGEGKCELRYVVGDAIVKSKTWITIVLEALGDSVTSPPEPQKAWVDEVLDAADDVMSATTHQPKIGENKNWLVWDAESENYVDTGIVAEGSAGKTPAKGVDYWTETDKAEIKQYIDGHFGNVEEALDAVIDIQNSLIGGDSV